MKDINVTHATKYQLHDWNIDAEAYNNFFFLSNFVSFLYLCSFLNVFTINCIQTEKKISDN